MAVIIINFFEKIQIDKNTAQMASSLSTVCEFCGKRGLEVASVVNPGEPVVLRQVCQLFIQQLCFFDIFSNPKVRKDSCPEFFFQKWFRKIVTCANIFVQKDGI